MRLLPVLLLVCLPVIVAAEVKWVGTPLPALVLPDQDGRPFDLGAMRGNWIALYFYPKNNTPGCTEEARQFRDHHDRLQAKGVIVVGVSLDDVASHREFAKKLGLPFTLLADTDGVAARAFGVLKGVGPLKYARRETFLIDPEGTVVYHYPEVNSREHAAQVLRDVTRLQDRPR